MLCQVDGGGEVLACSGGGGDYARKMTLVPLSYPENWRESGAKKRNVDDQYKFPQKGHNMM